MSIVPMRTDTESAFTTATWPETSERPTAVTEDMTVDAVGRVVSCGVSVTRVSDGGSTGAGGGMMICPGAQAERHSRLVRRRRIGRDLEQASGQRNVRRKSER